MFATSAGGEAPPHGASAPRARDLAPATAAACGRTLPPRPASLAARARAAHASGRTGLRPLLVWERQRRTWVVLTWEAARACRGSALQACEHSLTRARRRRRPCHPPPPLLACRRARLLDSWHAMATVVRGAKRPLDLDGMMDALPSSCGGAAHMTTPEGLAHIQKRQRYAEMMAVSAAQAGVSMGSSVRENPFPIKPIEPKELETLVAKSISPRKGSAESEGEMRSPGPAAQTPRTGSDKEAKGEKTYSHEELTSIVSKVVQQREAALREDYNKLLQAKLAEQFQSFTKFNEDYISRQIKGNPFSYVS